MVEIGTSERQTRITQKTRCCAYCDGSFAPKRSDHRFCSDVCRSHYHAEKQHEGGEPGSVRSVRALASGRFSVVLWFDELPPFQPGETVRVSK